MEKLSFCEQRFFKVSIKYIFFLERWKVTWRLSNERVGMNGNCRYKNVLNIWYIYVYKTHKHTYIDMYKHTKDAYEESSKHLIT